MGYVLGISANFHDSAAAIVLDGEIIAAAQEERFTRKKHDPAFPHNAINYCLGEAFIDPTEILAIAFYEDSVLKLDRVVKNAATVSPRGRDEFTAAMLGLMGKKAKLEKHIETSLGLVPQILTYPHHMSHAASCFFPSPFDEAAILVVDGVGEWATCSIGFGHHSKIELLEELRYPHSIGLLYSAFTHFCGFKVNSGEYKLMGLAPYGQPSYEDMIRRELIDVADDGSFRLNLEPLAFHYSDRMTNEKFEALFDGPARSADSPITQREANIAASIQKVVEDVIVRLARQATKVAGSKKLTMAGGVALNCVANSKVLEAAEVEHLFIQPAAGDAGGAIGAALMANYSYLGKTRKIVTGRDSMKGSLLGPSFTGEQIESYLDRQNVVFHREVDPDLRAKKIAEEIANGKVVGFFSGRMEFGPRALGSRSILADARLPEMQKHLNLKIKFRESFRPFAPAILLEYASEYFELDVESPYMLLTAQVKASQRRTPSQERGADDVLSTVRQVRSSIPAVTHVDYSARVQTVGEDANPEFRRLLIAFNQLTGCPLVANTSFNVRGEPIVCTPRDALDGFRHTDMDLLVLEDVLLWKSEQVGWKADESWKDKYEPD